MYTHSDCDALPLGRHLINDVSVIHDSRSRVWVDGVSQAPTIRVGGVGVHSAIPSDVGRRVAGWSYHGIATRAVEDQGLKGERGERSTGN